MSSSTAATRCVQGTKAPRSHLSDVGATGNQHGHCQAPQRSREPPAAQNPGHAREEAAIATDTSELVARCPGKGSKAAAGSFSTASAAACQN